MSYIHDALKKAQREKETLAGKSKNWAGVRIGETMLKQNWLASALMITVAFVFSIFCWIQSLDDLASIELSSQDTKSIAQREKVSTSLPHDVSERRKIAVKASRPQPATTDKSSAKAVPEPKKRDVYSSQKPAIFSKIPSKSETDRKPPFTVIDTQSLYDRAVELQKKGRLDDAINLYKASLDKTPNLVSALNNLGAVYIQQHKLEEAQRILEKAVRIDPRYADAYYNLACLHSRKKDLAQGIFYLKKSISFNKIAREWAKTDEDLRNLRNHSEYEEILHGDQPS